MLGLISLFGLLDVTRTTLQQEKMNIFVSLLFILIGSLVERSDSVSCYYCEYDSVKPREATCTQPFNATSTTICNGSTCFVEFINYTDSFSFARNCTNSSQADKIQIYKDILERYNSTYYMYSNGNTSCLAFGLPIDDGQDVIGITGTFCFCETDQCNGDIPPNDGYTTNAEYTTNNEYTTSSEYTTSTDYTTIAEYTTNTEYTRLSSTTRHNMPSTSFPTKPISKLAIVVVAIATAISTIN